MEEQDQMLQEITKAGLGKLARSGFRIGKRLLSAALKPFIAPLLAVTVPFLIKISLFIIAFTVLFLFPKFLMEHSVGGGKIVSIFNMGEKDNWTVQMDQDLAEKYKTLSKKSWQDGLQNNELLASQLDKIFEPEIRAGVILSQQEQACPHKLPWSVLAGVDRITGDPVIHKGNERKPNPDYHCEVLKPVFTWKTFEVVKVERIVETNDDGSISIKYITHKGTVYLLDVADTFEGNYKYQWTEERNYYDDGHLKSVMPKFVTIEKSGPFFQRLINLMAEYKITDTLEIETVLELAELYDDEYKIDAGILGTRVEGFQADLTKQYYTGSRGNTCLPIPTQYFVITSPFGMRIHPIFGTRRFHSGIDIGAPYGSPVYSAWDGVVVWAGQKSGYGNAIIVDHGDVKTLYGHLSVIATSVDAKVKGGDTIGFVGSTGNSTGPNLHFEVFKTSGGGIKYEDPMGYLK